MSARVYLARARMLGNLTMLPHNVTDAYERFTKLAALGSTEAQHVSHNTF
jgi:hypothetical protein